MKLLHLTTDWKWTGPAEPMLHGVRGLRERGHHVDWVGGEAPPDVGPGLLERARERGLEPLAQLSSQQGYRPLRDRVDVARLRDLLRAHDYDHVHVHHTRDLLLARAATRGSRTNVIASWHHGDPIEAWPWHRWLWGPRRLRGLAFVSERARADAVARLGWASEHTAAIPGVVDTRRFVRRTPSPQVATELGLAPKHRVLGVVARLQPHRRFELLLDVVAHVRHEFPNFRLLVVGRGTRVRSVLEEPVARLGLGSVVIRAGYRREDYLDVLSLMHGLAFLVPGSDGSCRAVLEAMSMDTPILSTRRGVLPELVQDGKTGRVVDETPVGLLQAVREFCIAPDLWAVRGRAAGERARAHHGIEIHTERLERFYASL